MHVLRRWLAFAIVVLLATVATVTGQHCSDQGSVAVAATVEPGPLALGCAGAPQWPAWHLLTAAHRAPAPHAGFDPGTAHARPRVLVVWRCTGWLLLPVVPAGASTAGYVIDRAERACTVTS